MDQSLKDAAQQGNIDTLYELIQKDANVLDRIDDIPFVETHLHIAASTGRTRFAMEIMKLKLSFARKLNQNGFTPMHLALQKLHELEKSPDLQRNLTQVVDRLLDIDSELVRVQGREGVTPFHYVAQIGNLDLLTKFSKGCPKSLEDVTIRRENVLHVVLKYDKIEAFRLLLGWLQRACFKDAASWERKLLYWKDEEHNTLLHVAVSKNQPEVVSLLLDRGFVDLKAKNLEGDTVFNILERQTQANVDNRLIGDMLMRREHPPRRLTRLGYYLISPLKVMLRQHHVRLGFENFYQINDKCYIGIRRRQTVITEERRNTLLVVAALLITVTYQAAFSPDKQPNEFNCTAPINGTGANHYFNQRYRCQSLLQLHCPLQC
ncbi:ankyrin repeat-containing protein BDA1-like [Corylus avellana]|uniref:ankyrin repeat-containing protein BDA1-like n=1 Tax=Corylus avellana TaxID=13451 RepID=UPI00286C00B5|nr:ankyrin repeat-containing protein BDA1-like [Corylus avellana]